MQGGVVEAVVLRLMGPLYTGHLEGDPAELVLQTIVPDVNDTAEREVARVPGVLAGDSLVVENLSNGEVRCGTISPAGTVRVSIPSDQGDRHRLTIYRGPALEVGSPCTPVPGAAEVAAAEGALHE